MLVGSGVPRLLQRILDQAKYDYTDTSPIYILFAVISTFRTTDEEKNLINADNIDNIRVPYSEPGEPLHGYVRADFLVRAHVLERGLNRGHVLFCNTGEVMHKDELTCVVELGYPTAVLWYDTVRMVSIISTPGPAMSVDWLMLPANNADAIEIKVWVRHTMLMPSSDMKHLKGDSTYRYVDVGDVVYGREITTRPRA